MPPSRERAPLKRIGIFVAFAALILVTWEGLKFIGGDPWRGDGWEWRPPLDIWFASDLLLPHIWDIWGALANPVQRGADQSLAQFLVGAAFYTWREAAIGFVAGAIIGVALAAVFVHSRLLERAFVPYVIASQTIPIVALAPMIVFAFGQDVLSVVIIATYLTFFPVTIAMIRGLRSPDPRALELMRSYAASRWSVFWKLRMPASLPYLFTALKISATASIVGAIVGEGPGGIPDGLGRAIVNFNTQYISGPEKLWATILASALLGIAFFSLIRVVEVLTLRNRGLGPRRHDTDGGPMTDPTPTAPIVRITGVDKQFAIGDDRVTTALSGIDLTIGRGEFVSLIGPSGCGKSTLLRLIGDLTGPTAGQVEVNGKPAPAARLGREYGMVFQAPVLFEWRTVEDNVKLPLELLGMDRSERDARAGEMLALVELSDFAHHHPYQLSGGMQQRVAIARALALSPSILLMDEPFGALDEMTRERMNSEVLRIWQQTGTTVVFVTHSIPEAVFLSSRVVVMSARPGRITSVIDVPLPHPRNEETREDPVYFRVVTEVREALRAGGGLDGEPPSGSASAERLAAEGGIG